MDAIEQANTHEIVEADSTRNAAIVYLASLSIGSRRAMGHALTVVANLAHPGSDPATFPWGMLRYEHTQAIRAALADGYGTPTANQALSALRGTLKTAWRLGQMTAEDYMRAADVANVKGDKPDQAAGRALTMGEIMALVASCNDGTPAGARDAAMLAVAYSGGLRRAEIVALDLAHVDLAAGVLTVHGKRNKVRTVAVWNGALAALGDWIAVRGAAAGALFTHIGKGNRLTARRLSTQAVYDIFASRAEAAQVNTFSPHDLRRTFAGDMLDAGVDISTVQKMMGHANVATTAGYDRRGERAKRDAAKRLHFPYQGKR